MNRPRWFCLALLLGLPPVLSYLYSRSAELHGHVVDSNGPVRGATVRLQADSSSVRSDACGRFRLPGSPDATGRLTAWKKGHRIAWAPALREPAQLFLEPLPEHDNEDYVWVDPVPDASQKNNCGNCHGAIFREWAGSAHAHSSVNPKFLDLYGAGSKHRS